MSERCKEIFENAYQRAYMLLDGEGLSEAERIEIETHLEECGPCLERVGVEREVISVVITRLRGATPCPEALKQRIFSLLEDA
ncbi:MAG TPA: zf-HC2 domain-containing protein [Actinomycetota bacterium]|nr:zf-HC2 domain-containing protein [Actinomycetota bacterium]